MPRFRLPQLAALLVIVPVLAATTTLAGPAPGASAVAAAPAVAPNPGVLRVWTPAYMARTPAQPTQAQAIAIAQDYDLIAAKSDEFAPYVSVMHQANPNLRIVAYINAMAVSSPTAYPSSWYLHDASGAPVSTMQWTNYFMYAGNPLWVANRIQACKTAIAQSGYDGCFLDVLGRSVVGGGNGYASGNPINPATGKPFNGKQYLAGTGALASAVRAAVAPKLVIGNNVGNGETFFEVNGPTSVLMNDVDVVMAEGFVRNGRSPLDQFNSVKVWLQDVTMLQTAAAHGTPLITVTKAWAPGTQAQKDALHEFALGTFLLGADGSQRFSFLYDESLDPTAYSPWWNAPLGNPTGSYSTLAHGVYVRSFTNGYVAVNPNARSVSLTLSTAWTDVEGQTVGPGNVTMAAHTGLVLYH